MIDWARIIGLKEDFGEAGFGELVAIFAEETGPVVERLAAGASPDPRADLHFVKGSAETMGLPELAGICRRGEAALAAGRAPDLAELRATYERACAALRRPAA